MPKPHATGSCGSESADGGAKNHGCVGIKLKLVYCYNNLRSLQKLRDGTGRAPAVEHGWMEREVDSDRDSDDSDDE